MSDKKQLYRVSTVLCICDGSINLGLLGFTILEEFGCNLREQCIGKNVLFLLLVLLHLFFDTCKLGLVMSGSLCGTLRMTGLAGDNLVDNLLVHRLNGLTVVTAEQILKLACSHLVTLAHKDIEDSLCSDNL